MNFLDKVKTVFKKLSVVKTDNTIIYETKLANLNKIFDKYQVIKFMFTLGITMNLFFIYNKIKYWHTV